MLGGVSKHGLYHARSNIGVDSLQTFKINDIRWCLNTNEFVNKFISDIFLDNILLCKDVGYQIADMPTPDDLISGDFFPIIQIHREK